MRLARLAAKQHTMVTARQLRVIGLARGAVRHRVETERLHVVYPGVYSLVPRELVPKRGLLIAAVMACGDGAVASHRAAADIHGLRDIGAREVEVTIPRRGTRAREGIRVHTTRLLLPDQHGRIDGIPVTSLARTLLDCAAGATKRELDRMLERAMILRTFDRGPIERELARAGGKPGTGLLRARLAELAAEPPPTRLELERRVLELVLDARLPRPVVNGWLCGHEVDFHWPHARVVLEADGGETHATAVAFRRDRDRDLALELAGWHVIRTTWRQVTREPERVVALLRARLA